MRLRCHSTGDPDGQRPVLFRAPPVGTRLGLAGRAAQGTDGSPGPRLPWEQPTRIGGCPVVAPPKAPPWYLGPMLTHYSTSSARYVLWTAGLAIAGVAVGCRGPRTPLPPVPAGRVVAITLFKGEADPGLKETIQDTFVDVFFKTTNGRPVKGDAGDIVLVGTVAVQGGVSANANGSGSSASGGPFVSGITVQAFEAGELIATHSIGQDLGRGVLASPVALADRAARYVSTVLLRKGELGRP